MACSVQQNLRGFSIIDVVNWNQTNNANKITSTAGDSFTQFIFAVETFFGYIIRTFNYFLPPETRDEQLRYWLRLAPYLIPVIVLIICICCFSCFFSCVCLVIRFLFRCVFSIIRFLFRLIFSMFRIVSRRLWQCLISCRRRPAVKIMKEPGNPPLVKERGVFEDNPQGYLSDLRENPSNFVC